MKSIHEALHEMTMAFSRQGMPHAKRQSEELLCDLLNYKRLDLYDNKQHLLTESQWQKAQEWIKGRLQGIPLAYLSGKVEFYGCSIEVNSSVLIPRPETEILVDKIFHKLKKEDLKEKILWDLCCGSGCIGIALKKKFPSLAVYLSDQSEEAIDLAIRNSASNAVSITPFVGDLFSPFEGKKADFIICNPPYISEAEYHHLDRDVKDFEPKEALVAGPSGLEIYERLAAELPTYLSPHGKVWLEIGYQQGDAVQKIFSTHRWKKSQIEKDWAGHNRFFFLENE